MKKASVTWAAIGLVVAGASRYAGDHAAVARFAGYPDRGPASR